MDFVQINKFTQEKFIRISRDNMYNCDKLQKDDSLRLVIYACKKMYGIRNTAKIIHGLGVNKIDLSS